MVSNKDGGKILLAKIKDALMRYITGMGPMHESSQVIVRSPRTKEQFTKYSYEQHFLSSGLYLFYPAKSIE